MDKYDAYEDLFDPLSVDEDYFDEDVFPDDDIVRSMEEAFNGRGKESYDEYGYPKFRH